MQPKNKSSRKLNLGSNDASIDEVGDDAPLHDEETKRLKSLQIDAQLEGRSSRLNSGEDYGLEEAIHWSWATLLMAHHKARKRVGSRVEAAGGLALDWYDTLLVLECAPDHRMRMGELNEYITLSQSGLSRLIDRIEAAGYVERQLSLEDRRVFEVILTAEGRAARAASWPAYASAIAEGFGNRYTTEQALQLAVLLGLQLTPDD